MSKQTRALLALAVLAGALLVATLLLFRRGPVGVVVTRLPAPFGQVDLWREGKRVATLGHEGREPVPPGPYTARFGGFETTLEVKEGSEVPVVFHGLGYVLVTDDPSLIDRPPAAPPVGASVLPVGIHEVEGSRVLVEEGILSVVLTKDVLERRAARLASNGGPPATRSVRVHRRYQTLLRRAGKRDLLVEQYRARAKACPRDPDAHYLLANVAPNEEALAEARRALRIAPRHFWSRLLLITEEGFDQESIAKYDALLAEAPSSLRPYALAGKGWMLSFFGRDEEAVAPLEEAAWGLPDDPEVREGLAEAYYALHRFADAREQADRVIALDPTSAQARMTLAKVYRTTGELDLARRALEALQNLDGQDDDTLFQLAVVYGDLGMFEEAVRALEGVLARSPGNQQARDQCETMREHLKARKAAEATPR